MTLYKTNQQVRSRMKEHFFSKKNSIGKGRQEACRNTKIKILIMITGSKGRKLERIVWSKKKMRNSIKMSIIYFSRRNLVISISYIIFKCLDS